MSKYPNIKRLVLIKDLLSKGPHSAVEILNHLHEKDMDIDSLRTIARDINILRDLGYEIEAPIINRGYCLVSTNYDEDLLERFRDFLILSGLPKSKNEDVIISSPPIRGIQFLPSLFAAVDNFYAIGFDYNAFTSEPTKRKVYPLVLKEYQGKWHLHSYETAINKFWTFGLDRIYNLKHLEKFNPNKIENVKAEIDLFKRRLGASKPMGQYFDMGKVEPQLIQFWVSSFYLNYLRTKPLHYSQTITKETKLLLNFARNETMTYTLVTYLLVPNYDLIKVIVAGLGDVVLEGPEKLKDYIRNKFGRLMSNVVRSKI
jgi:hypothetical protein